MTTIRPIALNDLPDVVHMQHLCYEASLHETSASFRAKIAVTPETCWLAIRDDVALAYLITLPVRYSEFPALNSPAFRSSATPDVLYIHDLAVMPDGRALGLGRMLVRHALQTAATLGIARAGLIAVQNSAEYWRRYGFVDEAPEQPGLLARIRSFGGDARYLEMPVPPASDTGA